MLDIQNLSPWSLVPISTMQNPEKHLIKIDRILKNLGVEYYLGFGTALGFYRDKDFIPNDTDIDINITSYDKLIETLDAISYEYRLIRGVKKDDKLQQFAFQALDGMVIDLTYFLDDGDRWISHHEEGDFADNKDVIGKLQYIETKYGTYPFPEKIEEYLTSHYGDWHTPSESKSLTF